MTTLGMCEQIVAAAERNAIMEYITNQVLLIGIIIFIVWAMVLSYRKRILK